MTIEITFPIRQEVLDNLARLGYTTDDVFEIGKQVYLNKKFTRAQVTMLMRNLPEAVFDEGFTVVELADVPNDMPSDKLQAHSDTVLDMIGRANAMINKALAKRQVIEYQQSKRDQLPRLPPDDEQRERIETDE